MLFESSSEQLRSKEDPEKKTTARALSIAYHLWLPFPINRVLNLTTLRSVINNQSIERSCFALEELNSAAQLKRRF